MTNWPRLQTRRIANACSINATRNSVGSRACVIAWPTWKRIATPMWCGSVLAVASCFARSLIWRPTATTLKSKPLVIEALAFAKKKAAFEAEGGRYKRMLSALAYTQITATIKARAHDAGLEVIARNPAYTSVIGREKFAERYGLGPHHAAALVIARRALNLSERPNRHARTARPLPARNRGWHVWAFWRTVIGEQRRMYRAGGRSIDRSRALPTPRGTARPAIHSPAVGAIPTRES